MHEFETAKSILLNENTHITHKMRALFTLRNILTDESALVICEAFKFKSILLKHELAYVLGQMRLKISLPKLISVLQDESENEIVRHECAEALGNFDHSDKESILFLLKKYFDHKSIPLRETVFLTYNKLIRNENKISIFNSYDPSMPLQQKYSFEEISELFLNKDTDLYFKYEILFYLRDLCSEEAILLLGLGMNDQSDLFKHEIAFVIGQIANYKPENVGLAVNFLVKELENRNNHPMVRHECAESLGAICNDYTNEVLLRYVDDECEVVKESCLVALDISDYKISEEGEYCVKVE